ncbi:MAG: C1 family peptidase [Clostridia bacterium]|nr:C1 family peptidase [Clostridia bacterium]
MDRTVRQEQIDRWTEAWRNSPERQVAALALSASDIKKVAFSQQAANRMHQRFSLELETLPVTNQEHSGRCWLFAAANVLREGIAKELKLESFELSQSWLAFWDKFERANYFLERIIETAALPTDDRTVAFVLSTGVHDGGQWTMFVNIVEKYGIVPKDAFDETWQSGNTRTMNYLINRSLKAAAPKLRRLVAAGAPEEEIRALKNDVLGRIWGFLCSCFGEPPRTFDFEYTDKEKVFHAERGLTPRAFADRYAARILRDTVSVIHAPTADKPLHGTYTIRFLGNVEGGRPVVHLNLSMEEMKSAIIRQLEAGKVVWFGSDVGHDGERERGIWDDRCFGYEMLSGLDLEISKEDALDYGFAAMNHAMVITGVNLVDGKPNRWKIENSWGGENGVKGYYVCSDTWFDRYVFQAAIEKEYLGELADLAAQEPKVLEPWDPMGTLAD